MSKTALDHLELPALTTVGWSMHVDGNLNLSSLDLSKLTAVGLPGVVAFGTVEVISNPVLPQCSATGLLAQLAGFAGTAAITGNETSAACPPRSRAAEHHPLPRHHQRPGPACLGVDAGKGVLHRAQQDRPAGEVQFV